MKHSIDLFLDLPIAETDNLNAAQVSMWLDSCSHFAVYLLSSAVCTRYYLLISVFFLLVRLRHSLLRSKKLLDLLFSALEAPDDSLSPVRSDFAIFFL